MAQEICSVSGCSQPAERSLSASRLPPSFQLKPGTRRAKLCREHYKEFKKLTKEQRKVEKSRYRL
ncbi:MAG: hypothetical protein QXX17_06600 [Conexivisphaerales archaeon]